MVSRAVILSAAKDPGIYFQRNTEMLRFAQHDNSDFFSNLLEPALSAPPSRSGAAKGRQCRAKARRYKEEECR